VTRPEERKGWLAFLVAPVPHPVRPRPSRPARVPSAQAYVLDYARVFGEGFAEGRRRGSAPR
jgi:hypothetical protein